jgi:hydroxyacyl-ACP dehydratase HTD2-like protein with hotdog domain
MRCFEDVHPGDEISLTRGPLSTMHLMRWSAAMENWHRIHFDAPFATGHEKLPGVLVNGSLKQQFICTLLKDWAGKTGWVWKVDFQFRAMNVAGETLTAWAKVDGKRAAEGFGLVDMAIGIRNEAGLESTPGRAVVALPFRNGPAVPYPFRPPAA